MIGKDRFTPEAKYYYEQGKELFLTKKVEILDDR